MTDEPMTADQFLNRLRETSDPDALIVCDKGVNGDDVVAKMLATGEWERGPVEYIGGKRIQGLVRVK